MQIVHVNGTDRGRVMLYALSTCGWCGAVLVSSRNPLTRCFSATAWAS